MNAGEGLRLQHNELRLAGQRVADLKAIGRNDRRARPTNITGKNYPLLSVHIAKSKRDVADANRRSNGPTIC
jgi:hypothetical protein